MEMEFKIILKDGGADITYEDVTRIISPAGIAFDSDLRHELDGFIAIALVKGLLKAHKLKWTCSYCSSDNEGYGSCVGEDCPNTYTYNDNKSNKMSEEEMQELRLDQQDESTI